jgi:hypothetical protein
MFLEDTKILSKEYHYLQLRIRESIEIHRNHQTPQQP